MKPLADIIRSGFPFYHPDYSNKPIGIDRSRYLCVALGLAYKNRLITIGERDYAHQEISRKLHPHKTLRNYLRFELGLAFPSIDDSFAFWNQWLNELENSK